MMKVRRAALAVLPLTLALAACGGGDDEGDEGGAGAASVQGSGDPVAEGKATGTLTVWGMGAEGEKLNVLAQMFMQENPGVKVNVTPIPWDVAHDKLLTSYAGGQTPDVSQMGSTWMGEFADAGALDEVPETIKPDAFFEGAWATNVVDDKAYGVPWYVETRLLFYRADIAKKAGITKPPATWDELKAMAVAMKQKGGAKNGIGLGTKNWQEYLPFVWSNGGEVAVDDKFALNSPEAKEALAYYDSFFEEGLSPKNVPEGFDITPAFIQGTHPMFFSGPWHVGLLKEQGGAKFADKWALAPMPKKETGTSFVGGSNMVVFKGSKNRDSAWKFVEFTLRPEVQAKWYETVAALPSVKSAWQQGTLASDKQLSMFGDQLEDAKAPPAIAKWAEVETAINGELEKVTVGQASPDQGADAMQQKADSIGVR
jgi:multiple sugar transport system substrate-binding protein